MKLACPIEGTWSVTFGPEVRTWDRIDSAGPSGIPQEFITGTCLRCGTTVLVNPSDEAVEMTRTRLRAVAGG